MTRPRRQPNLQGVDLSGGSGHSIGWYISHSLHAVETEGRRLQHRRVTMETRQVDAFFFVVALTDFAKAVEFAKAKMSDGSLRDPLRDFYGFFGNNLVGAAAARRHFDAWRSGLGEGQVRGADGSWIFSHGVSAHFTSSTRKVRIAVRLDKRRVLNIADVNRAVAAARRLAGTARAAIDTYVASQGANNAPAH